MKSALYLIAGWLVPGLGHLLQKRFWRAAAFFSAISAMVLMGLIMGGKIYPFQTENPLTILAFFADLGNFFIYALSLKLGFGQGALERVTFEFGTAYIAGAGLLNYLVALDAFDIARGKKT
jgi:hypothetical protein